MRVWKSHSLQTEGVEEPQPPNRFEPASKPEFYNQRPHETCSGKMSPAAEREVQKEDSEE